MIIKFTDLSGLSIPPDYQEETHIVESFKDCRDEVERQLWKMHVLHPKEHSWKCGKAVSTQIYDHTEPNGGFVKHEEEGGGV